MKIVANLMLSAISWYALTAPSIGSEGCGREGDSNRLLSSGIEVNVSSIEVDKVPFLVWQHTSRSMGLLWMWPGQLYLPSNLLKSAKTFSSDKMWQACSSLVPIEFKANVFSMRRQLPSRPLQAPPGPSRPLQEGPCGRLGNTWW